MRGSSRLAGPDQTSERSQSVSIQILDGARIGDVSYDLQIPSTELNITISLIATNSDRTLIAQPILIFGSLLSVYITVGFSRELAVILGHHCRF